MNCTNCGQPISQGAPSCTNCNAPTSTQAQSQNSAPLPQAQPLPASPPQAMNAYPVQPSVASAAGVVPADITKFARITGILAMVVSVLNLLAAVFVAATAESGEADVLPLILGIGLVIGLFIVGNELRRNASKDINTILKTIRFKLSPIMVAIILLNLFTDGAGIGLLPILIVLGAVFTLQKIEKHKKATTTP